MTNTPGAEQAGPSELPCIANFHNTSYFTWRPYWLLRPASAATNPDKPVDFSACTGLLLDRCQRWWAEHVQLSIICLLSLRSWLTLCCTCTPLINLHVYLCDCHQNGYLMVDRRITAHGMCSIAHYIVIGI